MFLYKSNVFLPLTLNTSIIKCYLLVSAAVYFSHCASLVVSFTKAMT